MGNRLFIPDVNGFFAPGCFDIKSSFSSSRRDDKKPLEAGSLPAAAVQPLDFPRLTLEAMSPNRICTQDLSEIAKVESFFYDRVNWRGEARHIEVPSFIRSNHLP